MSKRTVRDWCCGSRTPAPRGPGVLLGVALLLAVVMPGLASGSDEAKEQRWAEQVVSDLFDGEPLWLKGADGEFLALYTEPQGEARGAVLLMHGIGVHPDWPQIVNPLRVSLAEKGWATLSLQMPILPNEAREEEYAPLFVEAPPRIEAGIAELRRRGVEPIVAIGHSMGASMGSYYLAHTPRSAIKAFVSIGLAGQRGERTLDTVAWLSKIAIPVLDLYGENDLDDVVASAPARAAAAGNNAAYQQREVAGAEHFFDGDEQLLVELVDRWIDCVTAN